MDGNRDNHGLTAKDLHTLEWWTIRELANRWNTSQDTIRRMIKTGDLEAMELNGSYRIHKSIIEEREKGAVAKDHRKAHRSSLRRPVHDELGIYS